MTTPAIPVDILTQYQALQTGVGVAALADRTQVALTGKDRASFLHGFCTNDIKQLEPGQGCEAFLTNVQGKTIGFVNVFCESERLVLETAPGQAAHIIASLDRFLIREDVQLIDESATRQEIWVAGPAAKTLIEQLVGDKLELDCRQQAPCLWEGRELAVRRVDVAGKGDYLIAVNSADGSALKEALLAAGATQCEPAAVEIARIEAGTPVFGVDISDDNLPQEVDRNATAISFTKGCYLGQETVARLDALGHVNRLLRGIRISSDALPSPGTELTQQGKMVARLTSVCWSPKLQAHLALGYVRREYSTAGSPLESSLGDAEVVTFPLP